MKSIIRHLENRLLQALISRFIARQTSELHWGSEELIDIATIVIDELNHDDE
jgi:hypothetical protein